VKPQAGALEVGRVASVCRVARRGIRDAPQADADPGA
jgi:hypothetical protein